MNGASNSTPGPSRGPDELAADHPRPLIGDSPAAIAEQELRDRLRREGNGDGAAQLWINFGLSLVAQGREGEAYNAYRRASDADDPELSIRALLNMARLRPARKLLERAERLASPARHPAAVVDIAAALLDVDRSQAVRLLRRVLDEAPPPAPRTSEEPTHRRARAVAALRLAQLLAEDGASSSEVDALLQEAVDANDPGVTPEAAVALAERWLRSAADGCAADELLRVAWNYDHPVVSPHAGRRLVAVYEERNQSARAVELLEALAERGDDETRKWASERRDQLASEYAIERRPASSVGAATHDGRARARHVKSIPTLIVSAGTGARRLLHEMNRQRVRVVGLVDDHTRDPLDGYPVLGGIEKLPQLLEDHEVDQVWLGFPTAGPRVRRRVGFCCAAAGVRLRVLPNPFELVADRDYVCQLRPLRVAETYGEADRIDVDGITGDAVRGRTVMIIGAGGSIGSELARQVVRGRPRHLALVDRAEASLIKLENELKEQRRFKWTFSSLADAAHRGEIRAAMQKHRPDLVFIMCGVNHAELAEENLVPTARANVLGSWIATDEALSAGAERVVFASSDNAAQQHSRFDWTRAVGERAVVARGTDETCVCAVRLPNVFGTSGSVIELFEAQVRYGGPLTVTDGTAQRRYLTVHEAAQWLLHAAAVGEPSQVYAVDAGVRVDVLELARRIIRLRGMEPDRDVPISFRGSRVGEKLSQRLWGPEASVLPTVIPELVRIETPPWNAASAAAELRRAEDMRDAQPVDVEALLRRALDLDADAVDARVG